MPAARPMTLPITPITSASATTEPPTCRLLAPTARSNASSRSRWATIIEKVL
ncbi:Uncharacterised protein [Mycobacteroides abscessus subsp. abscessus]|nr:Uncharacterised protein [Mycobacteroides abscessus subsp. abscessus]